MRKTNCGGAVARRFVAAALSLSMALSGAPTAALAEAAGELGLEGVEVEQEAQQQEPALEEVPAEDEGEVISLEEPAVADEAVTLEEPAGADDDITLEELAPEDVEAAPEAEEPTEDTKGAAKAAKTPSAQYYVHRQTYGWEGAWSRRDGDQSGTTGQSKRLEGIRIRLANKPVTGSVQYRTHVQSIGWQGWKKDGTMSGTSARGLRLEAIQIKLTGNMAKKYDVWYRVHAQKFGWMGWAKNGSSSGTAGYAYRLESIQVVLRAKGSNAPAASFRGATRNTAAAFKDKTPISFSASSWGSWKLQCPSMWNNDVLKVKKEIEVSGDYVIYDVQPKSKASGTSLFTIHNSSFDPVYEDAGSTKVGTVRLKSGQKADVLCHKDSYFKTVAYYFRVTNKNNDLVVETTHYKAQPFYLVNGSKVQLTASQISYLGSLQTLGNGTYDSNKSDHTVPLKCLQAVASGLTVS